ncbi:MAG: hypothetical protein PWR01_1996 [Clostridiales bacterium]|jgi:hypothetical protein|nr:hypothetical protein [Clostridiales bacterium]MDN5280923.1 hypothetical protein [Candidatus Ozemobacter sp.]
MLLRVFALVLMLFINTVTAAESISRNACDGVDCVSPVVVLDSATKVEGENSLKIVAVAPCRVTVGRFSGTDFDNFTLKTTAKIKAELETGVVVLETLVKSKGGFYFSRAMDQQIGPKTQWQKVFTRFFFKEKERPDEIFVNLIIEGNGTVWVDDINIEKEKLPTMSEK